MSEFQYCYWLMGVFELGNVKSLNPTQVYLLKEHLALVEHREHNFCNWLEGALDFSVSLDETQTQKVLDKLRLEFLHLIDKSYPEEIWDSLQAAHDGYIVRC